MMANVGAEREGRRRQPPPPSPPPRTTCFTRLTGGATSDGVEFEYKLAGLVALRARSLHLHFEVNSNVAVARPFDDVVLRLANPSSDVRKWATYFIQLKHDTNKKPLTLQSFLNDKDFKLTKYFELFLKVREWQRELEAEGDASKLGKDERKLCEGSLDDCRFIIYTTKHWRSPVQSEEGEEDDIHSRAFKILSTGGKNSSVLRFCAADTEVWNLFSGDENETIYQQEFLPRLRIFCGQTVNRGLDALIENESKELFGDLSSNGKYVRREYLEYLKEWAAGKVQNNCLTETSAEYEWFMAEFLRERAKEKARLELLHFRENTCRGLQRAVDELRGTSMDALIVEVPGVGPALRAAKLLRTLDATCSESWVYVGSDILVQFPLKALKAVCEAVHCKIIVLDMDDATQLLSQIKGSVKIIDLGSTLNGTPFDQSVNFMSKTYVDKWRLEELIGPAQKTFLKEQVVFQGKEMQLSDLEETWPGLRREVDGALLEALVLRKAAMGQPPPPAHNYEHPELYIERQVGPFQEKEEKKSNSDENDHDFSSSLLDDSSSSSEDDNSSYSEGGSSFDDIFASEDEISSSFSDESYDLHENNSFTHSSSHGEDYLNSNSREEDEKEDPYEELYLPEFFKEHDVGEEEKENLINIMNEIECAALRWRTTLLLDDAGAGKSSFLKRLAIKTREKEPARWSVFVPVLQHRKLLKDMPSPSELTVERDLMNLLMASAEAPARAAAAATRRCLEAALLKSGAMTVFVDGVDELCPAYKEKVLRLLELLKQEAKANFWVSSRSEMKKSLNEVLGCAALSLLPLTQDEQKRFLLRMWASNPDFIRKTNHVILNFSSIVPGFLGYPLHLNMIADIGYDNLLILMNRVTFKDSDTLHSHAGQLVDLYREFVNIKHEEYKTKHFQESNFENSPFTEVFHSHFLLLHQNCAMFHMVADNQFKVDVQQFKDHVTTGSESLKREKTGIVWMDEEGKLHFSHYSFVEYFAACWLCENIQSSEVARDIMCEIYVLKSRGMEYLQGQIDWMLTKGCPLHRALITEHETAFDEALNADSPVDQIDHAGRTAMHMAVLYSNENAVRALLSRKCDLEVRDTLFQFTPLQYVDVDQLLDEWDFPLEIVVHLLQNGANTYLPLSIIFNQRNILSSVMCKGSQKVLQIVLEHGITLNNCLNALHEIMKELRNSYITDKKLAASQDMKTLLSHPMAHQRTRCIQIFDQLGTKKIQIMLNNALNALSFRNFPVGSYVRKLEILEFAKCICNREIFPSPVYSSIHKRDTAKLKEILETSDEKFPKAIYGITPLLLAVLKGHGECVECLLQNGTSLNKTDDEGLGPLHVAVESGNIEMVKMLLESGAEIDSKTILGHTPLHFSIIKGCTEIVGKLIANGCDVNSSDKSAISPLHYAVAMNNVCLVNILCKENANPNSENYLKFTPLHFAAITDAVESAEILLENGALLSAVNSEGQSSIHLAALHGSAKMLKRFLKCDEKAKEVDDEERSPLMYAALSGNLECVEYVLQFEVHLHEADSHNRTPLYFATEQGHSHIAKKLLDAGANANVQGYQGFTPLILAVKKGDKKSVEYLLESNADPKITDDLGNSPLHVAAECGNIAIMETVLGCEVDVNARTGLGDTPLILAAKKGHKACVEELLKSHVNLNDSCNRGSTALHAATLESHSHVVDMLLRAGADVDLCTIAGTPLSIAIRYGEKKCVELLLRGKADPNLSGGNRCSYLHFAVAGVKDVVIDIVKMLLDAGANVSAFTLKGASPLILAAELGLTKCVTTLLEGKLSLHVIDDWTPLHAATQQGHLNVMKILLKAGERVNARDANGDTPLIVAAMTGNKECVEFLLQKGANQEANFYGVTPTLCAQIFGIIEYIENDACEDDEDEVRTSPPKGKMRQGHEDCVKLLSRNLADPNATNELEAGHLHMSELDSDIQRALPHLGESLQANATRIQLIYQYFEIITKAPKIYTSKGVERFFQNKQKSTTYSELLEMSDF